ncbi:MAG: hypothetical protein WC855_10925 [Thermodesulfovibrionales bacterium]
MKYVAHILGIIIVSSVFYLFMNYVEKDLVLSGYVIPPAGILLSQWLDSFKFWASTGIFASLTASLLWYIIFQWIVKVNDSAISDKRIIWLSFFILPVIFIMLGIFYTKQAEAGSWVANLFYVLNGLFCYYFATALFSPSSFKYTPLWASKFRWWK